MLEVLKWGGGIVVLDGPLSIVDVESLMLFLAVVSLLLLDERKVDSDVNADAASWVMKEDELSILFDDKDEEDDKLEDGWYEEYKIEISIVSLFDCCDEIWIGWVISNVKIDDDDALELEDDDGDDDNMLKS